MNCLLKDKCKNRKNDDDYNVTSCDYCQYNADACLQYNFEFNGNGEEPTEDEYDIAFNYARD